MNSIYNIDIYNTGLTYNKHDIILFTGTFRGIPLVNKYLYCLEDGSTGVFNENKWDGCIIDNSEVKPKFIWTPSYNNTVENNPKVNVIKFGEGYESRIPAGINNLLFNYNLVFDKINTSELTAIIHFLTQRAGVESFIYFGRPPYVKALRYVAREWSDEEIYNDNYTLTVKFEQVVN